MAQRKKGAAWGFDTRSIDEAVRPQDDFYHFANGAWLKTHTIPQTEPRWGSFTMLRFKTERQLHALVKETLEDNPKKDSNEQRIADLYRSAVNMKRRNKLGFSPIILLRAKIRALKNLRELEVHIAHMHRTGIDVLWYSFADQDSKNSSRYLLHLYQGGLGLPEREYYLKDEPEQRRVRDAYRKYIRRLLTLSCIPNKEIPRYERIIIDLETELARASMSKEDMRDVEKTYHLRTLRRLSSENGFDWEAYIVRLGAKKVRECIVGQPAFFKRMAFLLRERPLEEWKIYLEWHLLLDAAPLLSMPFVRASFDFYDKKLSGAKRMKPLWRRGLSVVNGGLGFALGKLYVQHYFPAKAKRRMNVLVNDLFEAYASRIKALDWMSNPTKKKALLKLRQIHRKIGYPVRWKSYAGLRITPEDYFGNTERLAAFAHKRFLKRLRTPVDRKEWFMTPQTVNAYCSFNLNDIVFPAAILQPPFFSVAADDALNYGCIGAVIGHELTHAFDDQGSKFDGKGNMRAWWTKKDRERFDKRGRVLVRQYDAYKAAPGIMVNGQLTLGENIADLGGLVIAFDAYQKRLSKTGRKQKSGFSPEKRFFLGFALFERELTRAEFRKLAALTNQHSPGVFRINGPLSNFSPFYETFRVTQKGKLYRAPRDRVRIW